MTNHFKRAREDASLWARNTLKHDPAYWVIMDTETTGLDPKAEIVQIGVIDGAGKVLVNNVLVKPTVPIPPEATRVHGITNEMVRDAPPFPEVLPQLRDAINGKLVVIYNEKYDMRLLRQSARAHGIALDLDIDTVCAMLKYAEWNGDWDDYHGSFRWQKLQGGDHSALGDCRATLDLIKKMANG
ncbi:MAG: 3'-5' exonuclease [Chloroflexota bacterium]|jgi:DNA polymerase-3 subunit epsilon